MTEANLEVLRQIETGVRTGLCKVQVANLQRLGLVGDDLGAVGLFITALGRVILRAERYRPVAEDPR